MNITDQSANNKTQNKPASSNPFNFDDEFNNAEEVQLDENGIPIPVASKEDDKKKKVKRQQLKFDASYLIDNPVGLKTLYKQLVVEKQKNCNFKGQGHEVSDLRRLMGVYKAWHFNAMPKFEMGYFAERLQKVGTDKAMKGFMTKLRNHYKGVTPIEEFEDLEKKPEIKGTSSKGEDNKNAFEYINTSTNNNNYYDDYYDHQSKTQQSQSKTDQKPYFKLLDTTTNGTTNQDNNVRFSLPTVTTQVKQIQELTEEQLKAIEENRKKAQERKRKREETMQKSNYDEYDQYYEEYQNQQHNNGHQDQVMQDHSKINQNQTLQQDITQEPTNGKRLQTDSNTHYKLKQENSQQNGGNGDNFGFKMVYDGDDIDDQIDLNINELEDCLDDQVEKIQSQIDNGGFDRKLEQDEEGFYEYN
eukprot:403362434